MNWQTGDEDGEERWNALRYRSMFRRTVDGFIYSTGCSSILPARNVCLPLCVYVCFVSCKRVYGFLWASECTSMSVKTSFGGARFRWRWRAAVVLAYIAGCTMVRLQQARQHHTKKYKMEGCVVMKRKNKHCMTMRRSRSIRFCFDEIYNIWGLKKERKRSWRKSSINGQ